MKYALLSQEETERYCSKILMPEGAVQILKEMVSRIHHDPKLFEVYDTFYMNYIDSGYWTTVWEPLKIDPYVEEVFGKHASLFYLHAALERLPITEQRYRERGIPEKVFVETLRDISVWVQNAYNLVGYYSIRNFSWIWRHLEARLFRLGRLQFIAMPFQGEVKGFYNAGKDVLLLLGNDGMELRANGDMQGVCEKPKTQDGFTTMYEEKDDCCWGNPITPYGKGVKAPVCLEKDQWEKVLDKEDYLLDIHIPRDGEFTLEALQDSYRQAGEFFKKYFPEIPIKGMMCHTWLFTPQLQEMLGENSNIVQFQRQFYLYPTSGSVKFLWNFVFNELTEEKDAKPDTFLRRKVLEFLKEGKEIFDMRGIYLDAGGGFGSSSYMDRYDAGDYRWILK